MTKQEYYDLLVKTSTEGGFPAVNGEKQCLYRAPDGRKCAVGLLIPDEVYDRGMDYGGDGEVLEVAKRHPQIKAFLPDGMTAGDLSCVQTAHDETAIEGEWNHARFVGRLNTTRCFADVARQGVANQGGAMKYLILYWDLDTDKWEIIGWDTSKTEARKQYRAACKLHPEVRLARVEEIERQEP